MEIKSGSLWLGRAVVTGIVSFAAPKALVGAGIPLDAWATQAGAFLGLHVSPETAMWSLTAIVFTVLLFLTRNWGAKHVHRGADQVVTRRAQDTTPNQLYIFKNPKFDDVTVKSYLAVWSPKEYFFPVFSDYESRASSWPPRTPKEKSLTLHLYNPGPEDVRHVVIEWDMGKIPLADQIRNSGLFSGYIKELTNSRIKISVDETGALSHPFSTNGKTEIPILRSGETVAIAAPGPLQCGITLNALTESKVSVRPDCPAAHG